MSATVDAGGAAAAAATRAEVERTVDRAGPA